MNWQLANRIGQIAAVKAHDRFGIDPERYPISTSVGIDRAGLSLMWRPMPRLFGMYVEAAGNRGVLVSSMFTRATRRHTAAHELGHHELGHVPNPSKPCALEQQCSNTRGGIQAQGKVEMTAEAFAAWYLMPRRAVVAAVADLGRGAPVDPEDVYQLSLLLGTAYRATARHLFGLRMATWAQVTAWQKVAPGRLKRLAAARAGLGDLDSTRDLDVWEVDAARGQRLAVSPDDLVVLPDHLRSASSDIPSAAPSVVLTRHSGPSRGSVLVSCAAAVIEGDPVPSSVELVDPDSGQSLAIRLEPRPLGIYLPEEHEPRLQEARDSQTSLSGGREDGPRHLGLAGGAVGTSSEGVRP